MQPVAYLHGGDTPIPTPVCAQPGDIFELVSFEDDDFPQSLAKGSAVVVLLNCQFVDGLYVLEVAENLLLVQLFFLDAINVQLISLHSHFRSGTYRLNHIQPLGRVVEVYPSPNSSYRWVLYQEGLTFKPPGLPFYATKGPQKMN